MVKLILRYTVSWLLIAIILFLSFFKVPETPMFAVQNALHRRAEGDLGLAEADVAAQKPLHGSLLSGFVENGASLNSFLFGSIVSISEGELALVVVISVLVLAAVLFFYRELFYIGFDENAARISGVSVRNINFLFTILTALTVSIASRTVGTLIVSSMLVVPVACGMQMAKSYKGTLVCAIAVAVCTTVIGLFLSYYAGLKPGGMIVLLEVAWFVIVMAVKSFNK